MDHDDTDPSRRLIVGGLSAGLAAAFGAPALAQQTAQTTGVGASAPPPVPF